MTISLLGPLRSLHSLRFFSAPALVSRMRSIVHSLPTTITHLFARDYQGARFRLFSTSHYAALAVIGGINLAFAFARTFLQASPARQRRMRNSMVALLLVNEAAWHLWNWKTGQWTIQRMLPLHLCSLMVFASSALLLTRNAKLYEYVYFMGIGGALQGVITPDLTTYGFPHFRFFQTFIAHGAIITAPIYMTLVEGHRPTTQSVRRVIVGGNLLMLAVSAVNTVVGSNYFYLARKPDIPTLLDKMGPWPWYIIPMEIMGITVILLLYLPFAVQDWQQTRDDHGMIHEDV